MKQGLASGVVEKGKIGLGKSGSKEERGVSHYLAREKERNHHLFVIREKECGELHFFGKGRSDWLALGRFLVLSPESHSWVLGAFPCMFFIDAKGCS